MNTLTSFSSFCSEFFELFNHKGFRGSKYLGYLQRPANERTNDEMPVVDTAIVSPLLGLLGYNPAERVYNQNRQIGRPDFAPVAGTYGTCFVVEDKNTTLDLTLDLNDPDSHLSQLAGYARHLGVRYGWLINGRRLMVWQFDGLAEARCVADIDLVSAIARWTSSSAAVLSPSVEKSLHFIFDTFQKGVFTDPDRLESYLAVDLATWEKLALPVGTESRIDHLLVETIQRLLQDLQRDARFKLDVYLARFAEYDAKAARLTDDAPDRAATQLANLRTKVLQSLDKYQNLISLDADERAGIETVLIRLDQEPRAFLSTRAALSEVLQYINSARKRKYSDKPRSALPWSNLDELPELRDTFKQYTEQALRWHQRQATLRQTYRADLSVHDDYMVWQSLVQETMLGGLDDEERRDEFALQAAYVVFIRLLLIRVCEDKGLFPHRFLSDGGLQHWQEDIKRYLAFANGNPYSPLLDMAYSNAQNIYAHFFTGRELFNWYRLDRANLILTPISLGDSTSQT